MNARARRARRWAGLAIGALVLAAAAAGVYRMRKVQAAGTLPVAPARQGDFLVIVRCRGELKARRTVQIVAPVNVPSLRIVWQASPGGAVQEGDPVIRFDPSSTQQQLQEKNAALQQAQATLDQAVAEARITAEQDQLDLSTAKYDVERARMEASKAEIVSKLQGEESRIDLGLAEQKLRVQEATVDLHQASDKAKVASLTRQRDQAQSEVAITKERLAQMELRAPLSGVVIYLSNFSQGWINAKPFQVGDQVWPGGVVAEIPDLGTLEMEGKVEEIDRGRIAVGDETRVRIDSLPELTMPADLTGISPLTEQSFEWPPTRSFRAYGHIRQSDARLRPGMNGSMDVVVNRIPNAISIPSKAVFTRDGKPIVYLADSGRYRPVEVEVLARNPDEVAVKGIRAGAMVTLVEAKTYLREPGESVQAGDVVVKFDTTEQEFKLKEAEADLAEAEQQVIQAQADNQAKEEEARYALLSAKADVRQAELEARRNPLLAEIVARENTLALEAAKDHLRQLEHDFANRQATSAAAMAIQQAARNKAKVKAQTARQNIENMVLKAKSSGYVSIQQNTNGNFMYWGMQLPMLQVGDTVNAGMGVAQIPDLKNWEVMARIGELDRGHLSVGQKVQVAIVAMPGKSFTGTVKEIGGTTGATWDRHFDCKIALEEVSPGMRPGMSSNIVITTGVLPNSLWAPSQALFESDGRTFVYVQTGGGFVPHDVKMVRRSESQVVLTGISEGQVVALASPDQQTQNSQSKGGAMKALAR